MHLALVDAYCRSDAIKAVERGAKCLCFHDTVHWWGPRQFIEENHEGWGVIEANFDSGFGVMVKKEAKPECMYSQENYPTGEVLLK